MEFISKNDLINMVGQFFLAHLSLQHQGELLGSLNVRRPSSVGRRPFTFVCYHSSGHSFYSIIIKLCQHACLGNCSDDFEHGSSRMKNKVTGAKNRKIMLTLMWLLF
jgi:hypothetical protein